MRSDWKTWLSKRFSEALTSKLWNIKKKIHATEAYQNGAKLNNVHPLRFDQKSSTDPSKGKPHEIHGEK